MVDVINVKQKLHDEWNTDQLADWRNDDEVCELLDIHIPRFIEAYLKSNYDDEIFQKYLEYLKPYDGKMTYKIERSIRAYDRLVAEKLIKMA